MKVRLPNWKKLPGAHWEMLAFTVVLFVLVAVFVDLKPVVDENFFFSTSDPGFGQSKKIEQRFPSQPEVILAVSSRDISSPRYLGRIQKLTQQINAIDEVSAVKSLAEGPKSFQDALASPFWSRMLIAEDRKSSNVLVFLENKDPEKPIKRIERIMHQLDETAIRFHIAGASTVVEMIRLTLADRMHRLEKKSPALGTDAVRMTFPPSFWSMVCASLGFASLLIVQAKPLRELGFGGVLGTIVAFGCAYVMYPPFLRWAIPRESKIVEAEPPHWFWSRRFPILSAAVILVSVGLGFGLRKLNTDPSLLDYFKPHQELRDGLEYVDRSGGCNPLTLVVSAADGSKLNTDAAYQKMWRLHGALENYKDVGTVVSLPTLLAEGDRTPVSFLISYEKMMEIMEQPKYARVAKSFVTEDRSQTMFLLRMVEARRDKLRLEVVDDLRSITRKHGFTPALVGGIYYLQGRLAKLVASSLVTGLFWLNLLFIVIAWIVARSIRGAIAMIATLTLVPLCMLGGIGWLHVPMDVISAPATNVCIGIAIDSMIHLVFGVRRAERNGKKGWAAWVAGREEQWRGIVYSDVIFAAGFAIFALSNFPPTQRFGVVVLAGLIVDILANLFVLPLLGGAPLRRSDREK